MNFRSMVAEKKRDWWGVGSFFKISLISSTNPMSSMRSTSSSTILVNVSYLISPRSEKSFSLPGVPITKLGFLRRLLICLKAGIPPTQAAENSLISYEKLRSSVLICIASSRVGAMISTRSDLFFQTFSINGSQKCRGFSGSCICKTDQISSGHDLDDRLILNRSRFYIISFI